LRERQVFLVVTWPPELKLYARRKSIMRHARTWILLGAGALLVASTGAGAQARTTGSGIPISKEKPAVTTTPGATTTTVIGGEVHLATAFSIYALNEKNIAAHMATADTLEIELGGLAQTKGTDVSVRDFGTKLVNDHTAHLTRTTNEMIVDEKVGFEPVMNDLEVMRMRQMLNVLRNRPAGANWDAAFLRFQVEHHQNEIALLNANLKNAHDDDFEDHIEKSVTSLGAHRDLARSIAMQLGVSIP
jgi:putative membrane protein